MSSHCKLIKEEACGHETNGDIEQKFDIFIKIFFVISFKCRDEIFEKISNNSGLSDNAFL